MGRAPTCPACGKWKPEEAPRGTHSRDKCGAGLDAQNGILSPCDGPMISGHEADDLVRDGLCAPLLRAALKEALDGWQAWSFRSTLAGGSGKQEAQPRCDELRVRFLGGK